MQHRAELDLAEAYGRLAALNLQGGVSSKVRSYAAQAAERIKETLGRIAELSTETKYNPEDPYHKELANPFLERRDPIRLYEKVTAENADEYVEAMVRQLDRKQRDSSPQKNSKRRIQRIILSTIFSPTATQQTENKIQNNKQTK